MHPSRRVSRETRRPVRCGARIQTLRVRVNGARTTSRWKTPVDVSRETLAETGLCPDRRVDGILEAPSARHDDVRHSRIGVEVESSIEHGVAVAREPHRPIVGDVFILGRGALRRRPGVGGCPTLRTKRTNLIARMVQRLGWMSRRCPMRPGLSVVDDAIDAAAVSRETTGVVLAESGVPRALGSRVTRYTPLRCTPRVEEPHSTGSREADE